MNFKLVARIIGALLLLEAVAMLACGLFAKFDVVAGDHGAMVALFQSGAITGAVALLLMSLGGLRGGIPKIMRREAVVVVGSGWLLSTIFGGLPYMLCAPHLNVAGAFFEAASGFTTTGSSVIADLETWPRGILLWRAMTNWLGGIGILVLFVAVLAYLGVGSKSLFQNESSYRSGEAGMARIHDTALSLLKIYGVITVACTLGLSLLGMKWYDAVCHAMSTVSTGGFSPHNLSIGHYADWKNGWMIELWITFFMVLCSLNFLLFVVILRKNWKRLQREEDAPWFIGICLVVTLCIAGGRWFAGEEGFIMALREALFMVVSIASTTGFGLGDYQTWPTWSQALLAMLMLMGGCAGSTSGGFKTGRLLVFLKSARHEIVRTFRPNQIFQVTVNGNRVDDAQRSRTMFFLAMYLMIIAFSTVLVGIFEADTGVTLETCAGAVMAALSNIGPGFGTVGPTTTFAHLRETTQVFLAWLMILGRLELFALLVLFFPSAWRKY